MYFHGIISIIMLALLQGYNCKSLKTAEKRGSCFVLKIIHLVGMNIATLYPEVKLETNFSLGDTI